MPTPLGWPDVTALALLYLIAAWAVVAGLFEVAAAVKLGSRSTTNASSGSAG